MCVSYESENKQQFFSLSSIKWMNFVPKRYGRKPYSTTCVIQVNFRLSRGGGDFPLVLAYICVQCDKEAVEIRYAEMQSDEGRKH
jgi:hypothetical protein